MKKWRNCLSLSGSLGNSGVLKWLGRQVEPPYDLEMRTFPLSFRMLFLLLADLHTPGI